MQIRDVQRDEPLLENSCKTTKNNHFKVNMKTDPATVRIIAYLQKPQWFIFMTQENVSKQAAMLIIISY